MAITGIVIDFIWLLLVMQNVQRKYMKTSICVAIKRLNITD